MTFKRWALFFVVETALSLSPGPAVFYVVSQGVRGLRRTLPATLGILSANALYFALSATSLGALLAGSPRFFAIAKWAGAGYLLLLGSKALWAARSAPATALVGAASVGAASAGAAALRRVYGGALGLQLANPKALLMFLAVLPQFIDAQRSVGVQMSILAATSMLPEFCILLGYGWLAQRAAAASLRVGVARDMNRWLARIEGVGLVACATLVLNYGRSA